MSLIYTTEAQVQAIINSIISGQRNASGGLVGLDALGKIPAQYVNPASDYRGTASPSTNPGTPTTEVYYIASTTGTYTDFGGLAVTASDGLNILSFVPGDGWTKTVVPLELDGYAHIISASQPGVSELGKRYLTSTTNIKGWTTSSVAGSTTFNPIPILPLKKYRLVGMTIGVNARSFFADKHQNFIKLLNPTDLDSYGDVVSPTDAYFLFLSQQSAGLINSGTVGLIEPHTYVKPVNQDNEYSKGINIANGFIIGLRIDSDGVKYQSDNAISNFIEIDDSKNYFYYLSKATPSFTKNAVFYNSNFEQIGTIVGLPQQGTVVAQPILYTVIPPSGSKYVKVELASTSSEISYVNEAGYIFSFFEEKYYREAYIQTLPSKLINKEVVEQVNNNLHVFKNRANEKSILILGDSLSATGFGATGGLYSGANVVGPVGGWMKTFIQRHRPKNWYNYAAGGYTLSDTSGFYFDDLVTAGSGSFLRRLENFIDDFQLGNRVSPDFLLVMGCINDYMQNRHVTSSEMTGAEYTDYDLYMEETFMLPTQSTYNNNRLTPITSVNIGKIAGAMRYICERALTFFPNVKIIFCTPNQTTAHTLIDQIRCVRDMKWMANRLSIPIIDLWGASNMCMLFDYRDPDGSENHKLLGDNIHNWNPGDSTLTPGAELYGNYLAKELQRHIYD